MMAGAHTGVPMTSHQEHLKRIRDKYPLESAEALHHRRLSRLDRVAVWLARHTGEPRFFGALAFATSGWVLWNVFGPANLHFDPLPNFPLLNGITKVTQLCFLPLVLIGQNLESHRSKLRAEQEHRAMMRDAEETELVLERLARLEALLTERPKAEGSRE